MNTEILKDLPFYATHIGGFLDNFQNAFLKKDTDKHNDIIIKSLGHLSKKPNLTKLKNYIKKIMLLQSSDNTTFIHSHEILFGQKIYLKDYCKCIVIREDTTEKEYKQIKMLCDRLDIPLVVRELRKDGIYRYYTGLNNFLDYIKNA